MNIARRHTNVQKGVQQNGMGHNNLQEDELSWRRGKAGTTDVQENVKQNGIGKRNNKSFRRINEMFRNLLNGESDKNNRKHHRHGNRRKMTKKHAKPSRRNGNQNRKAQLQNQNQIDLLKRSNQALQEQVEALKTMLWKTITTFCNENDIPTRRAINKIAQDHETQHKDPNVDSRIRVIQSASSSRYNRMRPSVLDKYDEIIFLPNYEIVLK